MVRQRRVKLFSWSMGVVPWLLRKRVLRWFPLRPLHEHSEVKGRDSRGRNERHRNVGNDECHLMTMRNDDDGVVSSLAGSMRRRSEVEGWIPSLLLLQVV